MARIRTIKPEFWTHEELSALPEPTHMLAAALLNYADDEGYFNANPGLVKAACSPLREPSVSVPASLELLTVAGYVRMGSTADGKRYGQVVTFDEHQVVNRPTPSKIKALAIVWDASVPPPTPLRESSLAEGNREQGTGKGSTPPDGGVAKPAGVRLDACPHAEIVDAYHATLPTLRRVRDWTPDRQALLRTRWREKPERQSLAWWQEFFAYVAQSDFLMGRTQGREGRPFDCDLEWIVRPKNFRKIVEGKYENTGAAA